MTDDVASLVSDNLDIWTTAVERRSGAGRGGGRTISPYGIERLRALILDLAVRGKLVPQDASDEPAVAFLKRLKYFPKASSGDLPQGWATSPLAALGTFAGGITPSKGVTRFWGDGCPWVSPKDMGGDTIEQTEDQVTQYALDETSLQIVPVGSLLMVARSGILRRKFPVAITRVACTINQDMKALILKPGVNARFLQVMLRGFQPRILTELVKRGMTVESLIFNDFAKALWPLPPLSEQLRIIAKVDELMALCDALETESGAAIVAQQALVEALLATLEVSTNAADLSTNWARLEANFDTLFTTESSVETLKQTILELGVRGRLVPQDASDESASILLKAVKKSGRGTKQKLHPNISRDNEPFGLPEGWCWERFDNLIDPAFPIAYGVLVPGADQPNGIPFVRIADLSITKPPPLPEKAISPEVDAQFARTRLVGGEILMGVVGSIGKLGVAPASWAGANIARAICRIVPSPLLDKAFILWLLQSKFMQESFVGDTRTLAQPTLNIGLIRLAATPVPPLPEQRRIATKISEMTALCDALQSGIGKAINTQKHLADTVVKRAAT